MPNSLAASPPAAGESQSETLYDSPFDALNKSPRELSAEGPSFPVAVKLLASAMMLALVYWGWQAAEPLLRAKLHVGGWILLGGAAMLCAAGYVAILRGRTLISPTQICQRGMWTQRVDLATVSHAKLIVIPALAWLIAPRLMLRVRGRGTYTFFVADPEVLAMVQRLGLGQSGPVD